MLDTKGPEIRVRSFKNGRVTLQNGQLFTLTTDEVEGDEERVSITYKELPQDIGPGPGGIFFQAGGHVTGTHHTTGCRHFTAITGA